jgi:GNAT superfamily N-acetyltransferase
MADIAAAHAEATGVRKAHESEQSELAAVLGRAFFEDPQFRYLVPDDEKRRATLAPGFELFLRRLWFEHGLTYTTPGRAGAAIWELPDQWKVSFLTQLRLAPAMTRIYGRALPRLMKAITVMESNHPKQAHYYLPFIGVDDDWRGRGIGSALMAPMLERCDTEGMPAYLEASRPENVPLYERHGFKTTEEFAIGKGGPPIWRMWRDPQPS